MKFFNMAGGYNECVKYRAELSLKGIPKCKDVSEFSTLKAWETCIKDIQPFDHHPHT